MRVIARSMLWVACCALLGAGLAHTASAATVTVVMTGVLTTATDSTASTDGSLQVGTPYALTMEYDDGATDLDSSFSFGHYVTPGASASYEVAVGNYVFSAAGALTITIDDNNPSDEDILAWFVDQFSISGLLTSGVGPGAVTFSSIQMIDFSGSAHGSDLLTDLDWDRSAYAPDNSAFWLSVQLAGPGIGPQQGIQLLGTIDTMSIVAEPSLALTVLSSLAALGGLRRRFR